MAKKKRLRHREAEFDQKSAFLKLPGEIRTLIYRIALVKPEAIDLWPRTQITNTSEHPELIQRLKQKGRTDYGFRDQHDLRFLRQQLAVGLLGTCHQIRMEATNIFWQENIFRFSTDLDWLGLRRFLITIGPEARSRIKRLEVMPPQFACSLKPISEADPPFHRETSKNHPKLRMAKIYLPKDDSLFPSPVYEHVDFVCQLLQEERTLQELRLVIPSGVKLVYPELLQLDRFEELRFLDLSLTVEAGALIAGKHDIEAVTEQGIRVAAFPGAMIALQLPRSRTNAPALAPVEIFEKREWFPAEETIDDFLLGVERIFDESDCIKPTKVLKNKSKASLAVDPTARVLKGFGGCRFVFREGPFCNDCNARIRIGRGNAQLWKAHESHCVNCKGKGGYRYTSGIEVRKVARERRKGVVEDEESED